MTRKVIKIGSSEGVTIPKEVMQKLNLKRGDEVEVGVDEENKIMKIKPSSQREVQVDKELLEWTDEFIEEYSDALEELAQK